MFDTDLVLWRGDNTAVMAWLDRYPHRSVKLSAGTVEADTLVCPYSWNCPSIAKLFLRVEGNSSYFDLVSNTPL
ncbi:Rieske 2Fe-2S domain-containing protein [Leptolyngbya sp. AN03gr2]|uniref:Rieske 2Fe-2S domain-containing protein n=1 Tax=unclassified Leptolyngbya TaxID=2650499 RepID=UPI003D31C6F7